MILPDLVSNNSNKKVKSQKQTSPFSTWSVHYQMIPLVVESMVATWMAESNKLHLLDRKRSIVIHTSIPSSSTTKGKADNQDKLQTSNLGSHKKTKSIRVSDILDSFDMLLHFSFFFLFFPQWNNCLIAHLDLWNYLLQKGYILALLS
jgi:hypothetical protein